MDLLDSLGGLNDSITGGFGDLGDGEAGSSAEQLCRLIGMGREELSTNETALQQFLQACIRNINSSRGNGSVTILSTAATDAIIIAIYCLLGTGCILGNLVVILVVFLNRTMRNSVTNIMVVNLAVADFCVGIFSCLQAYLESGNVSLTFSFAPDLCKFQTVLQVAMLVGTVCILLIVCVDRYLAIVYPLSQRQHNRKRWYLAVGIGGWLFAIAFALPNVYFYEFNTGTQLCQVKASMSDYFLGYYCASVVLLFAIPLLVMSLAYGRVSARLLSSISQFGVEYTARSTKGEAEMTTIVTTNETGTGEAEAKVKEKKPKSDKQQRSANPASARKRTVQMFVTIVVAFFICKLPKTIYVLILLAKPSMLGFSNELDAIVAAMYLLYLMPSAINPLVYFIFSRQFRSGFVSCVCCRR